jgi:hypothetical protein
MANLSVDCHRHGLRRFADTDHDIGDRYFACRADENGGEQQSSSDVQAPHFSPYAECPRVYFESSYPHKNWWSIHHVPDMAVGANLTLEQLAFEISANLPPNLVPVPRIY